MRLRTLYASHVELTRRLDVLDTKVGEHSQVLRSLVEALRKLMAPPAADRRPIGFTPSDEEPEIDST